MSHNHDGHNHGPKTLEGINKVFYIGIALNTLFTIIEFIVGYATNSLALLADASHNLSDVASLIISLIGMQLAKKAATTLYTYGYKKASVLASLINAVLLMFIVLNISVEAFNRFNSAPKVIGVAIIITALIGVVINTVSAFLFYKGQKDDINVRGAFLHLLVDAVVSFGVVISGIVIHYTGWNIIDPIISFVIAFVVLFSTWGLMKESLKLTLDGVPKDIKLNKIKDVFLRNKIVKGISHLHIWALSSSENALTVHVILKDNVDFNSFLELKKTIKHALLHENIHHSTIEINTSDELNNCV